MQAVRGGMVSAHPWRAQAVPGLQDRPLEQRPEGEEAVNELMKTATATMSSREIAELTGKRHDNVMAVCRNLKQDAVCPEIQETPYINEQNGQTYQQFLLSKRDSLVLVARLSPEFTALIVDRWQELEAAQAPKLPATYLDALKALVASEESKLALSAENSVLKPKALIADQIHNADGLHTMAEAAKILGTGRTRLFDWLRNNHVIDVHNQPLQRYIETGYFRVKERPYTRGDEREVYAQIFVTGKGMTWLAAQFNKKREES